MGKEISHFIIHFLIFNVLTMIEDIVERFYRNFFSYMAIIGKKSINGIGTNDVLRCQDTPSSPPTSLLVWKVVVREVLPSRAR